MTQIDLFPELTLETPSYHLAIRANLSQSLASKEEKKTHATSIRTSLKSMHAKDPLLSFSKMFLGIFPLDLMRYSMIWRIRTTPLGRSYFQAVRLSERHINETGSGLLPTPGARDSNAPEPMEKWEKSQHGCCRCSQ